MGDDLWIEKKIVILGAGVSGHTAALYAKRFLRDKADITVVSPEKDYNWIPSNIWVGVNQMREEDVLFPLLPVYTKKEITFIRGRGIELFPEGTKESEKSFVVYESTNEKTKGEKHNLDYDYLINATGPKLNFEATKGLGPDYHIYSVCTAHHATQAGAKLNACIEEMKKGKHLTLVVGMGHGTCTCEGAAFEYVFNVDTELRRHKVRDKARLIFLSNEAALGDFGVDGIQLEMAGYITPSNILAESLFTEQKIVWILGAHVKNITETQIEYESLDATTSILDYDFAMLLPPFKGHLLKTSNKDGIDISDKIFNTNNFMKVDADYTPKTYQEWKSSDWPKYYQNPTYKNLFAVGIAFAPPHQISQPRKNSNGTVITPSPPRTGMPSAIMGRIVARNIADQILGNNNPPHSASMAELGAACIASIGAGFTKGSAVSITMDPIVPNFEKYPETGRDIKSIFGEVGRAGHWIKRLLHTLFIYKAKAKLLWWIIPE
ncbi:MAG: FAD/NAD(P)-binding oxidoreductase [Bacteriovorax sp.]|nr:FAD/NAD(P)-binding oxidoreductase [Bacteriovorax sp.]